MPTVAECLQTATSSSSSGFSHISGPRAMYMTPKVLYENQRSHCRHLKQDLILCAQFIIPSAFLSPYLQPVCIQLAIC